MTTRDMILDAAADVIRTIGLARATTKEIARASGYSEATLYKHFQDKEDLFLAVLHERVPSFAPLHQALATPAGTGTVRDNLIRVVANAAVFYTDGFPMNGSIFAAPALLGAHRTALLKRGAGPQRTGEALIHYLTAERDLGRIRADADLPAVAALLLGASLQYGFLTAFAGRTPEPDEVDALARGTVETLLIGIAGPQ